MIDDPLQVEDLFLADDIDTKTAGDWSGVSDAIRTASSHEEVEEIKRTYLELFEKLRGEEDKSST